MDFNLNFSALFADELQKDKISHREIKTVYQNNSDATVWEAVSTYADAEMIYYYLIGFSDKKRFLQLFIGCDGETIYFLQVKVADLPEIVEDFFRKL